MNTLSQTPTRAHAGGVAFACFLLAGAVVTNTQVYEWGQSGIDITPNTQVEMIPKNWESSTMQLGTTIDNTSICQGIDDVQALLDTPLTMQQAQCIVDNIDTLGIPQTTPDYHYTGIRAQIAPYISTIESKRRLNIELSDNEKLLTRAIATLSIG